MNYSAQSANYLDATSLCGAVMKMKKKWNILMVLVIVTGLVCHGLPNAVAGNNGSAASSPSGELPQIPPRAGNREKINLFSGKDLTGWVGHEKYWSVRDGVIVGRNDDEVKVSTYLLTERKFSDFRLIFRFQLAVSEMHSGIAHWGRVAPEHGDPYTYAGHLTMFPSGYGIYDLFGRQWLGVENSQLGQKYGEQHGWNYMEILAQGNRIRHVLNGRLIADWRDPMPDRIRDAPIGLQLHSNSVPQEVRFRDLVLETFPEEKLLTVSNKPDIPDIAPRIGQRETIVLFNGKDLTGWQGHEQYWSVRDGVIIGRNDIEVPVSTYLLTKRKFNDFRLIFDFRLAESEMHSGIGHWGRVAPEHGDPYTYAGHLTMFPMGYGIYDLFGRQWLGVENAPLGRKYGQQHGWNNIEILAQGNRIRQVLNGHLIADWRDPEPERILTGPIGLQLHSNRDPQEVQFKGLTLETFPDSVLKTVKQE